MASVARRAGYQFSRIRPHVGGTELPTDFEPHEVETIRAVQGLTLTSPERIVALSRAVEYIVKQGIPGDFVECGVWRGGSVVVMLRTLMRLGETQRQIHLFDTFEGMSQPTADDFSFDGEPASLAYKRDNSALIAVSLDQVKANVLAVGYDPARIHFIQGKVEDTIPASAPEKIALLRLDTDWYESTRHEMDHLYPRLERSGVLIIDDYGHWKGSRKAVDEYLAKHQIPLFLQRIDYTARIAVKVR